MLKKFITIVTIAIALGCGAPPRLSSGAPQAVQGYGNSGGVQTLAAGDNHNFYSMAGVFVLAAHASGSTITGFDNSNLSDQDTIFVRNQGTLPIVIAHEHTGSSTTNRVHAFNGRDLVLTPGRHVALSWDTAEQRWVPLVSPAVWGVESIATPSRSLNAAFCPSATRDVIGYYSIRIESEISLAGGERGRVALLSDTANPPTTIRSRVAGGTTGTVVIGLSVLDVVESVLTYQFPAGHCGLLQTAAETGAPAFSITAQTELTL